MAQLDTNTARVILGPDGQPAHLSSRERTEDLLGAYDGYLAQSFKIPPFNPDIFIASKGYDVLDHQTTLIAASSPLDISRSAILFKGWKWVPAITDQHDPRYAQAALFADDLTYACENIVDPEDNVQDFREVIWEIGYAIHTGFRVTHTKWRYMGENDPPARRGKLGFEFFAAKPCKQIGFDLDPRTLQVRNITSYTPQEGYDFFIPVEACLRYTYNSRDSLPFGNGLGRKIYKHTWSIEFLYKFWNIALEVFGSPFILGKAAPNAIALARQVIAQIRQGAPAVLPTGVEAQLIQVATGGLSAFYQAIQDHREECARAYLGATLTTGTTGGTNTNALGNVHQDTQDYGLGRVRADIEGVFSRQLARRFVRYNYGRQYAELAPRLSLGDWDAVDMANVAKSYKDLIDRNVVHEGEPVLRERLKLPAAPPDLAAELETRRRAKTAGAEQSAKPDTERQTTTDGK